MAQSLARVLIHLVFSTKTRQASINAALRPALHAYLVGTLGNLRCASLQTGGTANHVHILFSLARTLTIAEVAEVVKKSSSKWMKTKGVGSFAWQAGYGAFSVSESHATTVVRYIAQQDEHHRRMTFQEELRQLLERHRISYDERYVWD